MKTKDAIAVFGTAMKLAKFLNITPPAVSMWGVFVPKLRQYELREKMPDIDQRIMKLRRSAIGRKK